MSTYELIGQKLGHSFSKPIHEALGAYQYSLHELPDEQAVADYLHARQFSGCNVTIPYKQTVIPFLDELDERAVRIGAVNTIVNKNGKLTGYNTDYEGFAYMLARKNISVKGKIVLLLGSGGTAKTATAVLQDLGAKQILTASRNPSATQLSYQQAMQHPQVQVLINVSPAGMYPNNGTSLVSLAPFTSLEAVADVVYNPLKTHLLLEAEEKGLLTASGLPMLVEQAIAAARLYTGKAFTQADSERILQELYSQQANLLLVGMPGSGKSKLGKALGRKLGKPFIDLDAAIVQKAGKPIPQIFEEEGELAFRQIETEVLAEETKLSGRVIATGGGIVTQPPNLPLLKQNGVVFFIDRPLQLLETGQGRPLSTTREKVAQLHRQRLPLYKAIADITIPNQSSFGHVLHTMEQAWKNVTPG